MRRLKKYFRAWWPALLGREQKRERGFSYLKKGEMVDVVGVHDVRLKVGYEVFVRRVVEPERVSVNQ